MKVREVTIKDNLAYISLTKDYVSILNVEDLYLVSDFNWRAEIAFKSNGEVRTVYAVRKPKVSETYDSTVRMHRIIVNCPVNFQVDHINGNGLDNRRENLRVVTDSQNTQNQRIKSSNKSGYKGVFWHKQRNKWVAQIGIENRQIYLGSFSNIEEAVLEYEKASEKLHKEYKHRQ